MALTRTATLHGIRIISAVVIILIIVGYAIWRSLNYVRGPEISILSPSDGATIETSLIEIEGKVSRANNLSVNENSISITENGDFSYNMIIFPGLNTVTILARDQFGRSVEKELRLIGTVDFLKASTTSQGQ